jgi:hypothetical protein
MTVRLRSEAGVEYYLQYNAMNTGESSDPYTNFSNIPVGSYKAEVKTSVNGQSYLDDSDNYFSIVAPSTSGVTISSFWTDKTNYTVGDTITYYAKVVNSDGTPFAPQTGTDVMFVSLPLGAPSTNGGNSMRYNSTTGYYESYPMNPIPSTIQTGMWTAHAWAVKNGSQAAVSSTITYSIFLGSL